MVFRRRFFVFPIVAVVFALLWISVALIHRDWRAGYSTRDVHIQPINWPLYLAEIKLKEIWRALSDSGTVGLPQVRLYLPRNSAAALMDDIPDSTKIYRPAFVRLRNGSLERVQIRYRGDNPLNWLFEKKSIRLKFRKSRLRDGIRTFNFLSAQSTSQLDEYISYELARLVGIAAPRSRPVELFINDSSRGIHIETEHLGESFVRNRNIMPVNIYKGEQYNADLVPGTERHLFENPAVWSKVATYNRLPEQDYSDLQKLFNTMRLSENDPAAFSRLKEILPISEWAKFAAYQVLVQSNHNTSKHNMRLISDVWRGQIFPLPYDTGISYADLLTPASQPLDFASNDILRSLHQASEFLDRKYLELGDAVRKRSVYKRMQQRLQKLMKPLQISVERDIYLAKLKYYSKIPSDALTPKSQKKSLTERIIQLGAMETWIAENLGADPEVYWQTADNRLLVVIDGYVPAHGLKIEGSIPANVETSKVRSRDFPGVDIPTVRLDSALILETALFANRIESFPPKNVIYRVGTLRPQATRFEFVLPRGIEISGLKIHNRFSGEWIDATHRPTNGFPPTALNRPVSKAVLSETNIWSGEIQIDRDRVVRDPVKIMAGTEIRLAPGASLVFRQKLTAIGRADSPIRILPLAEGPQAEPWGTIALQGNETRGSHLRHVEIIGGSGDNIQAIPYTGMLSIHQTADVVLEDLYLGPNYIEDDTLHLVYVDNAIIRNLTVENAFGDGVDIDISKVIFDGGRVIRSKNDGIDLMSSNAIITGMEISTSGDKGVSVGERSNALVHNTTLRQNKIGIESKDKSHVTLVHADLRRNAQDLNAYKKNWRYGGGGTIETYVTRFSTTAQESKADKNSEITLYDSENLLGGRQPKSRINIEQVRLSHQHNLQAQVDAFPLSGQARNGLVIDFKQVGTINRSVR